MTRKAAFRSNSTVRNHARPRDPIIATNEAIEERLTALISPTVFSLGSNVGGYNIRERVLRLPVMVALLLTMVWRRVESVRSLAGLLEREKVLWANPVRVTQQALHKRLRAFPAALFSDLFAKLVPIFQARAAVRSRPLPDVVQRATKHFSGILAADGTTLEELFKKTDALRETSGTVLGGRLLALLDVVSKQPLAILRQVKSTGSDHWFQAGMLPYLRANVLLLLDAGFYDFSFFAELTQKGVFFIVRGKKNLAGTIVQTFQKGPIVSDRIMEIGAHSKPKMLQRVRVVDVWVGGALHRYLTNVLDPAVLSTQDVVDLYARRWRVEEAFLQAKRLLNLSYLWTGDENGLLLQIWATWLMYAVLIDLCDAIAEELDLPLDRISIEMVYRSLYFFCGAFERREATDVVTYLAAPAQLRLGIVKPIRKNRIKPPLANPPELAQIA